MYHQGTGWPPSPVSINQLSIPLFKHVVCGDESRVNNELTWEQLVPITKYNHLHNEY